MASLGYARAVAAGVLLGTLATHSGDVIELMDDTSTVAVSTLLVIVLLLIVPDIAATYRAIRGDDDA